MGNTKMRKYTSKRVKVTKSLSERLSEKLGYSVDLKTSSIESLNRLSEIESSIID